MSRIKANLKDLWLPLFLVLLGALARLLPHLSNATPIGALALFSGACLSRKQAVVVPLLGMALADLFLGYHSTLLWVYGSFALIALLGMLLKNRVSAGTILGASFASSLLFFLVTNFGVWASTAMYSHDLAGLMQSYLMGIPFFRNTLIGDLFYSGAIFSAYAFFSLNRKEAARTKTAIKNSNPQAQLESPRL